MTWGRYRPLWSASACKPFENIREHYGPISEKETIAPSFLQLSGNGNACPVFCQFSDYERGVLFNQINSFFKSGTWAQYQFRRFRQAFFLSVSQQRLIRKTKAMRRICMWKRKSISQNLHMLKNWSQWRQWYPLWHVGLAMKQRLRIQFDVSEIGHQVNGHL